MIRCDHAASQAKPVMSLPIQRFANPVDVHLIPTGPTEARVLDEEQQLIAKLRKIEALFARAGTEGERSAAENASNRIRARLTAIEAPEPATEFRFSLNDAWSRSLFTAVLRRHGLKPYRYRGQRRTSLMVRVVKSYLDATLWPEFLQLQTVLHEHFATVTKRVIAEAMGAEDGEVDVREGQVIEA